MLNNPVRRDRRRRVLLSTVSSDSHTWNLVFLQLLLEEAGHEVINLGPCVPDELLLDSARQQRPDAIVISTVNGHGFLDGSRMIRRLREDPELADLPVIIGGKLGVAGSADAANAQELLDAGFTAVFTEDTQPSALGGYLTGLPAAGSPRQLTEGAA